MNMNYMKGIMTMITMTMSKLFKVKKRITIVKNKKNYLSFPDIIRSKKNKDHFFIVYREAGAHHPTWSKLVLTKSEDQGKTWTIQKEFILTLKEDGFVWNCPRLSYINDYLCIICDAKSSTFERTCQFKTYILASDTNGESFIKINTPFTGMVPDKIINFKNKLFCANHKVKSPKNDLVQLVNWSKDKGRTWYDCNVVANDTIKCYCEASIVNMGDYLMCYLRENSGHMRPVYYTKSEDGINWIDPIALPIYGQRITAIKDGENNIIGTYRNTEDCKLSIFNHDVLNDSISKEHIDWEHRVNQYHFGYSGISECEDNNYLVTYYSQQAKVNPCIKLAFLTKN